MITSSELYWILTLDSVVTFSSTLTAVCGVVAVFLLINCMAYCAERYEAPSAVKWGATGCIFAAVLFGTIAAFTPSTKQMLLIRAVPAIVNGAEFKEMTGDAKEIYRMGVSILKKELENKVKGNEK